MTNLNLQLQVLLQEKSLKLREIKEIINQMPLPELVRPFTQLPPEQQAVVYRLLAKDQAIELFEMLTPDEQAELVNSMEHPELMQVIESLAPDDRVHLFDELPAKVTKRLIRELSPASREAINLLLGYPAESAGRVMTPRYLALRGTETAAAALAAIQASRLDEDELEPIFVIDGQRIYQGMVRLASLIKADPNTPLSQLATTQETFVRADEPQMAAARLLKQIDLPAVPVVDTETRLVGAVLFDDVIDLLEEEASETMYRKAGVGDLAHNRDTVFSQRLTQGPIIYPIRQRLLYLMITLAGGLLVGGLMEQFEDVLAAIISAAVFIPLVMDMGGNVGTQSTTIFARGLALGHINLDRFARYHLVREVSIGAIMGLLIGVLAGTIAYFWQGVPNGIPQLGIAVGVSLSVVVTLASFLGFALPWVLLKLGMDHAPGADPFITTIKDFTGLALYFTLVSTLIGVA